MTKISGFTGLVFLVAGTSFAAQAAAPPPSTADNALKLDGIIESLKKDAVEFNREAQDVEQLMSFPAHTRTSVYVSCNVSKLLLENVTVTIDEGKPVRYDYSERSAKALLLSDGLHRILLANVTPGEHTIMAEFRGRFADADKDDPPVTGRFEQTFTKTQKPLDLELSVARYTRLSKPGMSLIVWKKMSEPEEAERKVSRPSDRKRRVPR